jgi:IclR family acetate operon transcriptional repressor
VTETPRRPAPMKLLANARDVIELLSVRGPSSPAEIAEHLGTPRSSVYRLVEGLAAVDLVSIGADGQAELHLKWLHLADAARSAMSEWSSAGAALESIAEETGQTAFLSVPVGREAVCVDWAPGRGIGVLVLRPGGSLPLYAGGAGRVVLAFGTDDVEQALTEIERPKLTPWTKTTRQELLDDVEISRRQGYVHSDQDVTTGIGAIAVPVFGARGQLSGCLSLAGLATDVSASIEAFVAALDKARARLS